MKINIQNIKNELIEIEDEKNTSFLESKLHDFYPENVLLKVIVDKFGRDIRVNIRLKTNAHYMCDRCLSAYIEPFEIKGEQIFQIGSGKLKETDEVIIVPDNSTEIDITPVLQELILLNHPIKMLCGENCKGICSGCGTDLNLEECKCGETPIDPRWDELKRLIK